MFLTLQRQVIFKTVMSFGDELLLESNVARPKRYLEEIEKDRGQQRLHVILNLPLKSISF